MDRLIRHLSVCLLVTGSCLSTASIANGQVGPSRFARPSSRPVISPYLNLFRGQANSSPALNYYGIVRPQQQFMAQNEALNEQLQMVNRRSQISNQQRGVSRRGTTARYRMGQTGHAVGFLTVGGGTVGEGGSQAQNLGISGFNGAGSNMGAFGRTTGFTPGFGGTTGASGSFGGGSSGFGSSFGGGVGAAAGAAMGVGGLMNGGF